MESLSPDELEKYTIAFNSIKDLFNEKHKDKLLSSFQENLKKNFSGLSSTDSSNILRAKLNMWRYNWQVLQKYLEVNSPNVMLIIESIFSNTFSLSELALKNWENEFHKSGGNDTDTFIKHENLSSIISSSEGLEQKVHSLTQENEKLTEKLHKTQDELAATLELLQSENKTFLQKIINLSKQTAGISVAKSPIKTVWKDITPKIPKNAIFMSNRLAQGRELSLKQIKDIIEEIYSTKVKFDEKCREICMPIESMDQFMLTYLNQKFGLKSIITDWTFAIMKALDRYENEDAEVKLFSKIINLKINEDFRNVLLLVKDKIRALLKAYIVNNSPYMREAQVNAYLKEKMQGKLEEKEWGSLIVSIYSQEESEYMGGLIKDHIQNKNPPSGKSSKANDEILFIDFQNIILSYDLTAQETLLSPFAEMYKNHSIESQGYLNQNEFRKVCELLKIPERSEELLGKIDSFSLGKIGFSACVKVFTEEKVPNNNFSVLQALFFSQNEDTNS